MATVNVYPLEKVKIVKRWITGMIGWTILMAIIFVPVTLLSLAGGAVLLFLFVPLGGLLALWQAWYENEYYNRYFYDLAAKQMVIRKGVITTRETTLPYGKIQDVYVDQDIFDRIFGIWDVHVSTPTVTSGIEAHIDGLNRQNALALRDAILKKMHAKR